MLWGASEDNEVIDVGPTHVSFEEDHNGPRGGVNGLAGSAGLEGELRTGLDELIDVYGSAAEKEDSALDVLFGDSEEEIGQEDNFCYEVGESSHHQFEDGVNLGEDVFIGGAGVNLDASTETEPPTEGNYLNSINLLSLLCNVFYSLSIQLSLTSMHF
jgi:hypothetical protein